MIATDIISLVDAKDYLALDDTSRDREVKRMTKSAIAWVEKHTQHILIEQTKKFALDEGCVRVYDFPIRSIGEEFTEIIRPTYSSITTDNQETEVIEVELGYDNIDDIPEDLIELCYLMLKFFFYEQEGNGKIPESVMCIAHDHRRFIV